MRKIYFGGLSGKGLDVVGAQIASRLNLSQSFSDAEDWWEYAIYRNEKFSLNISKTDDTNTIKTWMNTAPDGINYQLIFSIEKDGVLLDDLEAAAEEALGQSLVKYQDSGEV